MIEHRMAVHFRDGEIVKRRAFYFSPTKSSFHVTSLKDQKQIVTVFTSLIKAVFFVKTFSGNKNHETHEKFSMKNFKFDDDSLKVRVDFPDGGVMYGMTKGYAPNRKGFFFFSADKKTYNERVFVIKESTTSVKTWR